MELLLSFLLLKTILLPSCKNQQLGSCLYVHQLNFRYASIKAPINLIHSHIRILLLLPALQALWLMQGLMHNTA